MHGTDDWADRHNGTRSRNEQLHSQLKDRNGSGLDDDAFELTGTARVALIIAIVTAATNLNQTAVHQRTAARNGGVAPYEDRHDHQLRRDRIIRQHADRLRGSDTTR